MVADVERLNVGLRSTERAIRRGDAKVVYIAKDADVDVIRKLEEMAASFRVEIIWVPTMIQLGRMGCIGRPSASGYIRSADRI